MIGVAHSAIEIHELKGHVPYAECFRLQEILRSLRSQNLIADKLLLLEHEPTITIGRSSSFDDLLFSLDGLVSMGVKVVECNRGGKAMLHLPGQVVIYAIVNLRQRHMDVMQFVRSLELAMIRTLAVWRINAARVDSHPGAWVFANGRWLKVGFIGVAIKRWVTMHGLALNASVDLGMFELLKPCGLSPSSITDMRSLIGRQVDVGKLKLELALQVASALNARPVFIECDFDELFSFALSSPAAV